MQPRVIELQVSLDTTEPLVWRRLWVKDSISMYNLHEILQVSMGWMHSHLFMFRAPGMTITEPSLDNEWIEEGEFRDARRTRLSSVLSEPGHVVIYEYDFGDSWIHTVFFERVVPDAEVSFVLPRCIGGANACPPEDCGGVHGFEELKDVLAKRRGREYKETVNWLDTYYPDYDPKEFSKGSVNKILRIGASKYLKAMAKL